MNYSELVTAVTDYCENTFPTGGSRDIQWGWNPVGGSRLFDAGLTPNYLALAAQVGTVTIQIGS